MNEFSGKVKVLSSNLASSDCLAAVCAWPASGTAERYTPPGMLTRMNCLPCATAFRISERERSHPKKEGESKKMHTRQSSREAWCV